ncbi:MAG: hypothetical protein ACTIKR_18300 [Advenella sp.]|uniref:hypothetical protein n=1 Tax=Advenella sp. TaxID=1872388 RepID=UPI003F9B7F88
MKAFVWDAHQIQALFSSVIIRKTKSPIDILAEKFSSAARAEIRKGAITSWQGSKQLTLWMDLDVAPRRISYKLFHQRREQMVGDAVQLTFDATH